MRLLRVQVPEFRALKGVDISFEPEFTPQVFPLGSLNGGGKSTLLQLVFILLNLKVSSYGVEAYGFESAKLEDSYFRDLILKLSDKYNLAQEQKYLATINILADDNIELKLVYHYGCDGFFKDDEYFQSNGSDFTFSTICEKNTGIQVSASIIDNGENITTNDSLPVISNIMNSVKKQLFLISPSNQNYLFFTQEQRRLLYTSDSEKNHYQLFEQLKNRFPNFFTYDFIDVLTEMFRLARDNDFDEKRDTGVYGTHYEHLENTINSLFIDGKKIVPLTTAQKRHTKDSIQSIAFKLPSGEEIYPEDLSHGELKRLTIFILLKFHDIQNSIVLIDEIENGFHPDWQRHIVDDLVEWGASNQYILATHSYELCRGVMPAHVKELPPNLLPES